MSRSTSESPLDLERTRVDCASIGPQFPPCILYIEEQTIQINPQLFNYM